MTNINSFTISHLPQYILAKCLGKRKNLTDIINNAGKIFEEASSADYNLILIDYSEVTFSFPMSDAFNITKMFELKLQHFMKIKMAVVVPGRHLELGLFWQEISQVRGFEFEIFINQKDAESWLVA